MNLISDFLSSCRVVKRHIVGSGNIAKKINQQHLTDSCPFDKGVSQNN